MADPVITDSEVNAALKAFSIRIPDLPDVQAHILYMAMLDALTEAIRIREKS